MHAFNNCIPQTEQHEPEGRMLFHLGNVTYLLDVIPTNPLPYPLSPPCTPAFLFVLFKFKDLGAKQHPTNIIPRGEGKGGGKEGGKRGSRGKGGGREMGGGRHR